MPDRDDDDQGARQEPRRLDETLSNAAAELLGAIVDLLDDVRRMLQDRRPS
jgi:hypothetical protein